MQERITTIKNSFLRLENKIAKTKFLLEEAGLDDNLIRFFFNIEDCEPIPYGNIMFVLACQMLCNMIKNHINSIEIAKYDIIAIKDNNVALDNDYNKCLNLLNSETPPESLEEMYEKTGINRLKLMMYIKTDGVFNTWFNAINMARTAEILENTQKNALKEDYAGSLGKSGHKWGATKISLDFMNKDFMKKNNSNIKEEVKDDIENTLKTLISPDTEEPKYKENDVIEIIDVN